MANPHRVRQVTMRFDEVEVESREAMSKAIDKTAKEVQRELKAKINRKGHAKLRSKPGEPPRRQTGGLWRSVKVSRKGFGIQIKAYQYGFWLDGGTGTILPRPWITPTVHTKGAKRKWKARVGKYQRQFRT